ncbi:MAG: hypothetical protein ABFS05_13325 [Bacteroidota bacterium]
MPIFPFPIENVQIRLSDKKLLVEDPLYQEDYIRVSPEEISIDIEGVACFHMSRGEQISITPYPRAGKEDIRAQLEKWGVMSILHQRQILNFHASSFSLDNDGIMICGDTGAGKSSLTAAFSFGKGNFLNDDITAIHFSKKQAMIVKYEKNISIFPETLRQLQTESNDQFTDMSGDHKYSIETSGKAKKHTPLKHIFHLQVQDVGQPVFKELTGHEKFSLLRGNICSWEMLQGMPGLEAIYLKQLLAICETTPITSIQRPKEIAIKELAKTIKGFGF